MAAALTISTQADAAAETGREGEGKGEARALATRGWEMTLLADDVLLFFPSRRVIRRKRITFYSSVWQERACRLEAGTPARRKAWDPHALFLPLPIEDR